MTANVELTNQELADLKALTNESDTSAALRQAMREYIRYAKRMRLKELSGMVTMDDNWQELEQQEMDAQDAESRAD